MHIAVKNISLLEDIVNEIRKIVKINIQCDVFKKEDLKRGDVVFGYEPIKSSRYIDIQLKSIPSLSGFNFKSGMILDFIWETKEITAVFLLEAEKLSDEYIVLQTS